MRGAELSRVSSPASHPCGFPSRCHPSAPICLVCTHSTCSSLKLCEPIGPCRRGEQTVRHEGRGEERTEAVSRPRPASSAAHPPAVHVSPLPSRCTHALAISWQHSSSFSLVARHAVHGVATADATAAGHPSDRAQPPPPSLSLGLSVCLRVRSICLTLGWLCSVHLWMRVPSHSRLLCSLCMMAEGGRGKGQRTQHNSA